MKESVFVVRPETLSSQFPCESVVPSPISRSRSAICDSVLILARFRKFAAAAICADMLGLSGNVHGEMKSHPEIINGRLKDKNQFIQIYHWHF